MPRVTNQAAKEAAEKPQFIEFEGQKYERVIDCAVIHDDPELAERMAAEFGSTAKHAGNKFKQDEKYWKVMSVVPLEEK